MNKTLQKSIPIGIVAAAIAMYAQQSPGLGKDDDTLSSTAANDLKDACSFKA